MSIEEKLSPGARMFFLRNRDACLVTYNTQGCICKYPTSESEFETPLQPPPIYVRSRENVRKTIALLMNKNA